MHALPPGKEQKIAQRLRRRIPAQKMSFSVSSSCRAGRAHRPHQIRGVVHGSLILSQYFNLGDILAR